MRFLIALGFLVAGSSLVQAGGSNVVAMRNVPMEVRQAAERCAPNVKWLIAGKDSNGYFKLLGKDTARNTVEFTSDSQGKDILVRNEIPLADVPQVVKTALAERISGFEPHKVQACSLDGSTIFVYRFQGAGYEGGEAGVYVSISGRKVTPVK